MRPKTTSSCWYFSTAPATTAEMYSSAKASAPATATDDSPASLSATAWRASRQRPALAGQVHRGGGYHCAHLPRDAPIRRRGADGEG